jgi:hypothetical protein
LTQETFNLLKSGALHGATSLKLQCGLRQFPPEIYQLEDTLEILDLNGNALTDLPNDLHRLTKLRILFCSFNQFKQLPLVLGQCPSLSMIGFKSNQINDVPEEAIPTQTLRWLILTDNAIKQLPASIGHCAHLQKLMLAGNQLTQLPQTFSQCQALELLRISANRFETLPEMLFLLPSLSWLAYAGNPFCNAIERDLMRDFPINPIHWADLKLGALLGEGASGVIYQADYSMYTDSKKVAVKLFKGQMTSDGLPSCEMHASLIAGEHPHLVGAKGVVQQHPDNKMGLVLPLLPSHLSVLGQPPTFESCSRDIYPHGFTLTARQAKHIAQGVAKALLHLHNHGIMHGDCYAHNILWSDDSVVLSDLGGASFLPLYNKALTTQLLAIEQRAFNILLQELAVLSDTPMHALFG